MFEELIARIPEGATPGPWFVDSGVFHTVRCGANAYSGQAIGDTLESREVFREIGAPAEDHQAANAALIALAPELATALIAAQAEIEMLRKMLGNARLQLVYLDERSPSGTTPAVIAQINAALAHESARAALVPKE